MAYGRDYEVFDKIKRDLMEKVDANNAANILIESKEQIIQRLETLDVNNIIEVEDLYFIVARLTQAAAYEAAIVQGVEGGSSVSLESIATEDVAAILVDTFKNESDVENFSKFYDIDGEYKPAKQAWAGLHARMLLTAEALLINALPIERNKASPIERYQENLTNLQEILQDVPKGKKGKKLFEQGEEILKQVKLIAGDHPENLSSNDLKVLTDVLMYANALLKVPNNVELSKIHAQELAGLAQQVSGKSSPAWKALGIGLLTFACAALVVVGVLAAIPSGGSSLLLTAVGAAGLAATISVGAGVAVTGGVGAAALIHGREKGLAKSMSQFKEKLSDMKSENDHEEGLDNAPGLDDPP